ncbi:helix-turn-helix domain-containing protein [Bizionia myxarmorum]|uniref:Helix-turn-helix domain-containing protein n=1 Tax=Bizionia myxarmorum TaxID=291186 RepID=A0A5D0R077_9FLAO|nr:helix-turn-helix domain-containing protein [Bizionia myxarmorum]TYB74276.1 helix-turn-helix domain-containing protein [Bizionia myxarmorum]
MITKTIQITELSVDELANQVADKLLLKIEAYLNKIGSTKNEVLLTRKETAEYFKVSLVTIHHWTKNGILNATYIGNRVYYKKQAILEIVEKQTRRLK